MEKEFISADLYLSSAISILLKIQPTFKVENGRTLFVFPVNDDLYKAMNAYNNGIPINAIEYAQQIKRLRAEMLLRRKMDSGNDR
jgi:hypothetical protein